MTTWTTTPGPPTAAGAAATAVSTIQSTANTASTGVQGVADGIHQAINGDTATGTAKTAAAVKANLIAIPPKNITAQDYGVLAFGANAYGIPANASIYLPTTKITAAQYSGISIGASTSQGLWLAEPGLYSIETIATFTANAGLSFNGSFTPTLVYGDTAPPTSGTWTDSHALPVGTSATAVDQSVTYCICGNNTYVRTDVGNRYFLPGVLFSNSNSTTATLNLSALAMVVVKLSN